MRKKEKSDVMLRFGANLKHLRKAQRLSQDQFAEALGVSRGSISFYETASRTADIDFLMKVSEVFGVSLDALLRGRPEQPSPTMHMEEGGLWNEEQ